MSLLLFALVISIARAQTFEAGAVAGINASQVNGDFLAGFDKLGVHLGLKVIAHLTAKSQVSVELLYSQRGSRSNARAFEPLKIITNYVEIPILFGLKDWLRDDYYKMRLEGGVSVGRLFDSRVETVGGDLDVAEFAKFDLSLIADATFYAKEKLGFGLRYTTSVTPLLDNAAHRTFPRLRGYLLTFRTIVMF